MSVGALPRPAHSSGNSAVERWKVVADAPGYEVSDLGRVRGVDRTVLYRDGRTFRYAGQLLIPTATPGSGYHHVKLKERSRNVHTLVLHAFVGPPKPGQLCRHLNGIPGDNRLSNLRWGTASENSYDTVRHGRSVQANLTHCLRGHRLQAPNLGDWMPDGQRACLACCRAKSSARRLMEQHGVDVDLQALSDLRYQLIIAGRPSGGVSAGSTRLDVRDHDWVLVGTTRAKSAHVRSVVKGIAVCGRPASRAVASASNVERQCRNCVRLVLAGVGLSTELRRPVMQDQADLLDGGAA